MGAQQEFKQSADAAAERARALADAGDAAAQDVCEAMDALLDHGVDERCRDAFKQLARRYASQMPRTVDPYLYAYREMYEEDLRI